MGRPGLALEFQAERRVNAVRRRLASTEKAEKMLGFRTEIPLQAGLRDLVEWWRSEREVVSPVSEIRAVAS
jgi:UDP-glucose 4-epimerase